MWDSRLIQFYVRLNKDEKRKLKKWIKAEFVHKNHEVFRFVEYLDSRTSYTPTTLTKERVFRWMYPNEQYNDLKIRHLLWLATEAVESFMVHHRLQRMPVLMEQLKADYYSEKELFRFAAQAVESGLEELQQQPGLGGSVHWDRYKLLSSYFTLHSRNDRSQDFRLQEAMDELTCFILLETLKYACIGQSLKKVSGLEIEHHLLPFALQTCQDQRFFNIPAIRIYYHIYLAVTEEQEAAFAYFLKDIEQHRNAFAAHELKDIYLLAINFCIRKSNQNKEEYTRQAFELYRYATRQGYLTENGEISRFAFTNVVALGVKLKEYAATEQFIQQYAALIADAFRQHTIDFNTAKVLYSKKQYKKALNILLTSEFKDVIWNLNAKYLALKIFIESDDWESFHSYWLAYRQYVQRKSNIGYHKTYFTQVVKALKKLSHIAARPDRYQRIVFDPDTPDREWMEQQRIRLLAGTK